MLGKKLSRKISSSQVSETYKKDLHFYLAQDEGEMQEAESSCFLQSPVIGRRGQLSFPVSFSRYDACSFKKSNLNGVLFVR